KGTLVQPLQRWNPIAVPQSWLVVLYLGDIQGNDFWIFLGLDPVKPLYWLFHSLRQVAERANILTVHFRDGEVSEIFVADRSIHRKHLAEHNNPAMTLRKQFPLKPIEIDESLRCVLRPIRSPLPQILAG